MTVMDEINRKKAKKAEEEKKHKDEKQKKKAEVEKHFKEPQSPMVKEILKMLAGLPQTEPRVGDFPVVMPFDKKHLMDVRPDLDTPWHNKYWRRVYGCLIKLHASERFAKKFVIVTLLHNGAEIAGHGFIELGRHHIRNWYEEGEMAKLVQKLAIEYRGRV